MLRILAWNLMHGGGPTRTAEAAIYLTTARADVVVLSEFRAARGSQLLAGLADAGLTHALSALPARGGNTVTIASRWPLREARAPTPGPAGRLLGVEIMSLGLFVLGVHIPDESATSARDRAWSAALGWARLRAGNRAVVAGDFNTSREGIDPPRPGQTCAHCMGVLESLGYADAWRKTGGGTGTEKTVSWHGSRGERQRLDSVYASKSMSVHTASAWYDATCVQFRLSDHCAVVVNFDVGAPAEVARSF